MFALVCVAMVIPILQKYIEEWRLSPARITRVVEKKIEEAEKWLEKTREKDFPSGERGETLFQEQGLALFYRDDSTNLWSTQAVSLDENWPPEGQVKGFLLKGNGFYLPVHGDKAGNDEVLALILIKKSYTYKNRYLPNRFQADLRIPDGYEVSLEPGGIDIHGSDGSFLFSLEVFGHPVSSKWFTAVYICLWMLAYFFLAALLYHVYLILITFRRRHLVILMGFILDMVIIRGIMFWFRVPYGLHENSLFSPATYAAGTWIPSLGDLLLHAITVWWISWVAFRHLRRIKFRLIRHIPLQWLLALGGNLVIILLGLGASQLFRSLIIDSQIHFGLDDPFRLSGYSLIGYFIIFILFLSWILLAYRWIWILTTCRVKMMPWLISLVISVTLAIWMTLGLPGTWWMIWASALFLLAFWSFQKGRFLASRLSLGVLCLIGLSALLTVLLQSFSEQKEKEKRQLLAVRMTQSRDQIAEYLFEDMQERLRSDTSLSREVNTSVFSGDETDVKTYLRKHYFYDYWDRYEIMATVCAPGRLLEVKPANFVIECRAYFDDLLHHVGLPSGVDSLYFIDLGVDNSSYLAVIPFTLDGQSPGKTYLFLEIFPKHIPRGMGYPELLMDEGMSPDPLREYAYAIFRDNELIRRVGRYYYSNAAYQYSSRFREGTFFNEGGYSHYLKQVDQGTMVIMSLPRKTLLDRMAPFSYFLVFATLLLVLFYFTSPGGIFRDNRKGEAEGISLRARLQLSMVTVVLVSFVLVAAASLWFLSRINENKNHFALSEKAHSVLIELEHKLHDYDHFDHRDTPRIQELLSKFSLVFFSDLNLYGTDGYLLASSRGRLFDEGLISQRMNAEAWDRLSRNQESLIILEERIGDYRYLSAYMPFRNNRNELLAYLNLPYFARQEELRQEIAGFLVAIINIYVILIALTLTTALVVAGYITKPLHLIGEKIKRVRLGGLNERLEWRRQDEIGRLVDEYNRMVDQLAVSAELLASNERDYAWREMAKQVAHEIKNPLTPMKLSVQYLQRAWNDKAPDWEERLKRFTATLTEQIDALSEIASAFSDFARMPRIREEVTDLSLVAQLAMDTFHGATHVKMMADWDKDHVYPVRADRSQLLRVFNNLLKNAIQAIGEDNLGRVDIRIKDEKDHFQVSISDDGPGIPGERKARIFTPNFTTKSSGMGLGLAIVKGTVRSFGGDVWYESEENLGTTFYFTIPVHRPGQSGEPVE